MGCEYGEAREAEARDGSVARPEAAAAAAGVALLRASNGGVNVVVTPPPEKVSLKRCCKIDSVEVVNIEGDFLIRPSIRRGPGGCCVLVLTVVDNV